MPKNSYTFLIIPQKKSSTKKITVSGSLLKTGVFFVAVVILSVMYMYYDYLTIKREKAELARLKRQTKEQKVQIEGLAEKINNFAMKMEELNQLDKHVRLMVSHDDKRYKGQILGIGGSMSGEARLKAKYESDQKNIVEKIHEEIDQMMDDANAQRRSFADLLAFLKKRESILAATPSIWPVQGWVTSEFGYRKSPIDGNREFHKGIDIATRMGVPIVAPADGIVKEEGYDREMGYVVGIDHGYGMTTWFGHLQRSAIRKGSMVKRGAVIGYVGNSGRSTGSHLHYSLMLNGVHVNPRKFLP